MSTFSRLRAYVRPLVCYNKQQEYSHHFGTMSILAIYIIYISNTIFHTSCMLCVHVVAIDTCGTATLLTSRERPSRGLRWRAACKCQQLACYFTCIHDNGAVVFSNQQLGKCINCYCCTQYLTIHICLFDSGLWQVEVG